MNIPADADLREFVTRVIKHRSLKLATKVVGLSAGDTVLPIGELISAGLTVYEVYEIYNDWQTFQRRRNQALQPTPVDAPSKLNSTAPNAKDAGRTEAGPDLSREQPILDPMPGEDPVSQPFSRDINKLDRQLEAKHNAEIREADKAENRMALREPSREFYSDQIYHPRHRDNLALYENWLIQNDLKWLNTLNSGTERQFKTLTDGGKDFTRPDLLRLNEVPEQVKRQLLAHNTYKSDLRARELLDYSILGVNVDSITNGGKSFNLKELLRVRRNFDAVFAESYGKSLNPKVVTFVSTKADELYRKETGAKVAKRDDPLWKTLRNIELIKYDRNIWGTVLTDPPEGEVMKTVVEQPRDPKDNVLENPTDSRVKVPEHTGHGVPEMVDTESKGFDLDAAPKGPNDTAHRDAEDPAVANVFTAKEGEIPGVDIPFRKVNPKYPANSDVLVKVRALQKRVREDQGYDCSEIAEDLLKAAKGKGQIIQVSPGQDQRLKLYEFGEVTPDPTYVYHQVYTDGRYVYDPRVSTNAIPKGDWEIMIRSLNPESSFEYLK